MKKIVLALVLFSASLAAQVPAPAFNPMTASGAAGIDLNLHTLYWQNPSGVVYNECFFSSDSAMVASMSPSVKIQSGSPSTINESVSVNSLAQNTRYFWRVVEHNASGSTPSPIWNFRTTASPVINYVCQFNGGLEGFSFAGPLGINNWYWSNSSGAGGTLGELVFRWDPIFIGDSYMISPEIPAPAGLLLDMSFKFYEDWWSNYVVIGCAYTTDNGYNWTSIWEISASGNVGPDIINEQVEIPGNFRLGFYYTGNSNDIDFYRIDDVYVTNPSIAAYPPSFLKAEAASDEQKVILNWNNGSTQGAPITGYKVQRKAGLPGSNSPYFTLTTTGANIFSFEDNTIELNQAYTYRVCSVSPDRYFYGNESSAYVPEVVPVELISFTADVDKNEVILNWVTASEINNKGFEIETSSQKIEPNGETGNQSTWKKIGFVNGAGTTTEKQIYTFNYKGSEAGKFKFRLKQIDLNGSYEYSQEIEAEINLPKEFTLYQNYPNPFNPSTTIAFILPDAEFVSLKIYNVLGREIKTIVNNHLQAGEHKFVFDAGETASGVYIYRLTAGKNIEVRTMQLLK